MNWVRIIYLVLAYALLAVTLTLALVVPGCAGDPLLELICSDAPDKHRCIEEHTRR